MMPDTISVVSPVYQNEGSLEKLTSEIISAVSNNFSDYEIILVDDGSSDHSWEIIEKLASKNPKIKGIKLSRNFGQQVSTSVGINKSKSNWICTIDADLQDPPSSIISFYQKAIEGYDIVYGVTSDKKSSLYRKYTSKTYFWLINKLTGQNLHPGLTSFTLFSRKVADEHKKFSDLNKNHVFVLNWLGFKSAFVMFPREKRFEGQSSYKLSSLLKYAFAGIYFFPANFISHFVKFGFVVSLLSFLYSLILVAKYFLYNIQPGWTSLAVLVSFFGGFILFSIGMIGLYVGKIFEEVKQRPPYVIDREI